MEKNYYTVKEIMAMLGISRPTVYSLLKQNQLRWLMLGGKYRIFRKSFDEWLEGRMNTISVQELAEKTGNRYSTRIKEKADDGINSEKK